MPGEFIDKLPYHQSRDGKPADAPAGHFEHCLRAKGSAGVRIYADPASGWRDMRPTTVAWYRASVGLVRVERVERIEPASSAFLASGKGMLGIMFRERGCMASAVAGPEK